MKNDGMLIQVDLDFKNTFNSAGHSCLWTILKGFEVPDVWLLKKIYENSSHQEVTLVYICRIRMRLYVIKSLNDIFMSKIF